MTNPFFKNNGPFKISDILGLLNINKQKIINDSEVFDIRDLLTSNKNDITLDGLIYICICSMMIYINNFFFIIKRI